MVHKIWSKWGMGLKFSKGVQKFPNIGNTKKKCLFLYCLKLQHENDRVQVKSTPSSWFIDLLAQANFAHWSTSIHPSIWN